MAVQPSTEAELLKDRIRTLSKVLFASTVMVFGFAIFNAFSGFSRLAVIETALVPMLMFILWRLKSGASVERMENGLMGCAVVLFTALFIEGGIGDTGIYWVVGFPFVAYFIKGSAQGMRWSTGFLLWLMVCVIVGWRGLIGLHYTLDQLQLFAVIYGFYAWLAHLFKSQIEFHQKQMLDANRMLTEEFDQHRLTRLRLQAILDHSPIAVWMEQNGRTVFLNRTCRHWHGMNDDDAAYITDALSGLLSDEAVARQYREEDAQCLGCPEQPLLRRMSIHCADGQDRIVDTIRVGLGSEAGGERSLIGFCVDVTERVRAEQQESTLQMQMQHAQRLESLGMMAGGIAHDFNNVLTAIQGNAELALAECGNPVAVVEHIDSIREATGLAALLCQQMLAYSGKGRFVVQPVSLTELIRDMQRLLEASVSKRAQIAYDLSKDMPLADGDSAQLRQIVLNLVLNAAEAIHAAEGRIDILTGCIRADDGFFDDAVTVVGRGLPSADYLFLEVRDNGQGMSAEVMTKVFDPFFTTKAKGHGLGMSAVQGIVRSHGGGMKLESMSGKGTSIRVYLPVSKNRTPVRSDSDATVPEMSVMGGTVLLVDDDDVVRRVARKMLQQLGFQVVEACDGHEALDVFRASPEAFNCVLLDLMMPRMDGTSCMRRIYELRPSTPVVLSSGYNRHDDLQDMDMVVGDWLFLKKPYSFDEMRSVMARFARNVAC